MTFSVGDAVVATEAYSSPGRLPKKSVQGTILSISHNVKYPGAVLSIYEFGTGIKYLAEEDECYLLGIWAAKFMEASEPVVCDCGSVKTYGPKGPHAEWCSTLGGKNV